MTLLPRIRHKVARRRRRRSLPRRRPSSGYCEVEKALMPPCLARSERRRLARKRRAASEALLEKVSPLPGPLNPEEGEEVYPHRLDRSISTSKRRWMMGCFRREAIRATTQDGASRCGVQAKQSRKKSDATEGGIGDGISSIWERPERAGQAPVRRGGPEPCRQSYTEAERQGRAQLAPARQCG